MERRVAVKLAGKCRPRILARRRAVQHEHAADTLAMKIARGEEAGQ